MGTSSPGPSVSTQADADAARTAALFDSVAVMRPTLLIPLWTMQLLGALHATASGGAWPLILVPPLRLIALMSAQTALVAAAYIINQITDAGSDAANEKLKLVADRHVPRRVLVVQTVGLVVLAGLLAWLGSIRWGYGAHVHLLLTATAILGVAYSVPPIRLKARAGWDLMSNGLGFGIVAFVVGWSALKAPTGQTYLLATPYFLCVAATFAFTTIPDIPGDSADSARTLGVVLGAKATAWVGVAMLVAACVAGGVVRNGVALGAAFVALPLLTLSTIRIHRTGQDLRLTRTTQIVILTLSLIAAVGVPVYAVSLIAVISFVRWYYARRFGMRYP